MISGADIGGESPQKAPAFPGDAAISFTFDGPSAEGGETHQAAEGDIATLTTQHGTPIADDQNSLKQGARGPTLLEDFHFREKIFHFDHERIPERVVHARGYGAHGFFELTDSLADVSRADIFQRVGERTRLRALLNRRRLEGQLRSRARRARLRGQALHAGRQLGPRRQQYPASSSSRTRSDSPTSSIR